MVGRAEVLTALLGLVTEAGAGRGQVALVLGSAGIGKSRLVEELSAAVGAAGVGVAAGHCDELDRSLPFAPLLGLLRSHLDVLRRLGDPPLLELATLLPELAPGRSPAPIGEGELIRTAARGVVTLARNAPLLVVEDLHWADESSLATLGLVARQAATLPILAVLTLRPEEASLELSSLLAGLSRLPQVSEWTLEPLPPAGTAELVGYLVGCGAAPPPRLVERIHLITEGNPLFVEEVVGSLELDPAGRPPEPAEVDRLPVPRSVQAAVWQRSRHLSPAARELLQSAAVAGRRADVNLLAELAGLDETTLLVLLRELLATQLVVEESADRIAFRHELTRRAVTADLLALARERRALHLGMAEALERRYGSDAAQATELARHFWEAEVWPKARHFAAAAGRHAFALGAPHAAIEMFTTAIDACAHSGEPPAAELLAARGAAYELVGEFDRARVDFEERLRHARAIHDRSVECAALVELGSLWTTRDYGRAGDLFRRGLDVARALATPEVLAAALNRVGSWHLNCERPEQAGEHHLEALRSYEAAGDTAGVAATLDLLGTMQLTIGDLAAATGSYREAGNRFRDLRDWPALASTLAMRTFTAPQYLGVPATWSASSTCEVAVAAGEESIELCRTMGWRSGEALGHAGVGCVLGQHGRYREAFDHGGQASRLAEAADHPYWMILAGLLNGALHLDLLAAGAARSHLQRAFDIATEVGSEYWRRTICGFLVDSHLLGGDRAAARSAADAVEPGPVPGGRAMTMGLRHMWRGRAEVALAEGDQATASQIVEGLQAAIALYGPPSPPFELLRGRVLAASGRRAEALAVWQHAIAESESRQTLPVAWRLHAELGRALRASHRLDQADRHLALGRQQVAHLARDLGEGARRQAFMDTAAALLPGPTLRRAAKQSFGGLTVREREVATLVAEGRSNQEIAASLVLSPRTVEKHIEHVLDKLALGSRGQVAAWAFGSGLLSPQKIRETGTESS